MRDQVDHIIKSTVPSLYEGRRGERRNEGIIKQVVGWKRVKKKKKKSGTLPVYDRDYFLLVRSQEMNIY